MPFPRRLGLVLVVTLTLAASPVASADAFADWQRAGRERWKAGGCLTDVPGTLRALRSRARPPVRAAGPARKVPLRLEHPAPPRGLAVLDASCDSGACAVRLAQSFGGYDFYEVDPFAASAAFLGAHPDTADAGWDELVYFTTFLTTATGGAYYVPISNDVSGITRTFSQSQGSPERFDLNPHAGTGSRGFLKGAVLMSEWHKCLGAGLMGIPCDDTAPYDASPRGILGVLGQEVGHRWGSFLHFRDGNATSDELLGRDLSHWSYYADTDGSPLEGNRWRPDGSGYRAQAVTELRFGPLDLYTMGLLPPSEVPPTLVLREPSPAPCTLDKRDPQQYARCETNAATAPGEGARRLTATAKEVAIEDIVAAEGERLPAFPDARRIVHLGFALLELPEADATAVELAKLDDLRRAFTRAFYDGTGRRMRAVTTVSRHDDLPLFDFVLDAEGFTVEGGLAPGRPGVLSLGGSGSLRHRTVEFDAGREKYLQVRLAARPGLSGPLKVSWWREDETAPAGSFEQVLAPDGRERTYVFPLEGRPGWSGGITGLELQLPGAAGTGALDVDWIELTPEPLAADPDADGIASPDDDCPQASDADQGDLDRDGIGDACDPTPPAAPGSGGDAPAGGCGCGGASPAALALLALPVRARRRRHR